MAGISDRTAGSAAGSAAVADPVGLLTTAIDALAVLDPSGLGDAAVAEITVGLRKAMDRLDGCFARLAATAHGRAIGADGVNGSTAGWLAREAGMRPGDARGAIDAGRACGLLAATGDAWRSGGISTAAARTITAARVAGHDDRLAACEDLLLGFARRTETRALRRSVAHFRNLAHADGTRPAVPDGLHLSRSWAGRTVITGELADVAAETITTAIDAYTDPPDRQNPRPLSERHAESLVRIAQVALGALPHGNRPRAHVSVVVDWATLTAGRPGRLDGDFTGPIHPDEVRTLLCDCDVSRIVTGPGGRPIDVGRTTRTTPPATRRALITRDGGCRFPGCDKPAGWCDAHHLHHWVDGGPTDLANLALLCPTHHRAVHRNHWHTTLDPSGELHIRGPDHHPVR